MIDRFEPGYLAQVDVAATISFIDSWRTSDPNARLVELTRFGPMSVSGLIDTPGTGLPAGFLRLGERYTAPGKIRLFGVQNYKGSVLGVDTALTLSQAVTKLRPPSASNGICVGRINSQGQCTAVADSGGQDLLATGAISKIHTLGAAARLLADEGMRANDRPPMDGTTTIGGNVFGIEPLATTFCVSELMALMMCNRDSIANDMLHQRVGRTRMNQVLPDFQMQSPVVMRPLLSVSENSTATPARSRNPRLLGKSPRRARAFINCWRLNCAARLAWLGAVKPKEPLNNSA